HDDERVDEQIAPGGVAVHLGDHVRGDGKYVLEVLTGGNGQVYDGAVPAPAMVHHDLHLTVRHVQLAAVEVAEPRAPQRHRFDRRGLPVHLDGVTHHE